MKKILKSITLIILITLYTNVSGQLKKFCAQDNQGNKYEINLTEGSGSAITRVYSRTGEIKNELSGTFSMSDEGVYGSAYFVNIKLRNGNMKFLATFDSEGKIQELKDLVAGRVFLFCSNFNSFSEKATLDDGSKYSFNQEKVGINGEITIANKVWSSENLNTYTFRNGDSIHESKTNEDLIKCLKNRIPAWCYYNNDAING